MEENPFYNSILTYPILHNRPKPTYLCQKELSYIVLLFHYNSRENCGQIQFDILFSTFSDAEIHEENMDRSKSITEV